MNLDKAPTLWEQIKKIAFFCFPHHWVSSVTFSLARIETHWKNILITRAIQFFEIDMSEAEYPYPEDYKTFNAFFTRKLKASARTICEDPRTFACPCDGIILESGNIQNDSLLQAKGQSYTLSNLFGDASDCANNFINGKFMTIYLAPRNYHRVHMPVTGQLKSLIHVPGRLFSVAPYALKTIPCLYGRNERVITLFETKLGQIAIVMVGAINVGSITINQCGTITPRSRTVQQINYPPASTLDAQRVYFKRGEEMGRFNLGSTVILLTENPHMHWNPACVIGNTVRMGEELACHIEKRETKEAVENISSS